MKSDGLCYIKQNNPVIIPIEEPFEESTENPLEPSTENTPEELETPTNDLTGFKLWWNLLVNWFKKLFD